MGINNILALSINPHYPLIRVPLKLLKKKYVFPMEKDGKDLLVQTSIHIQSMCIYYCIVLTGAIPIY